jgi:Ser/Thr protein kinase RdoA (MazF antagonist)
MVLSADTRWGELVVVDAVGKVIGKLPPVRAAMPWWSEVESLVRAAREAFGVELTILRMLRRNGGRWMRGGHVTYLAETVTPITCLPCDEILQPHPLRNAYAETGGPGADLAWARSVLAHHGLVMAAPPLQIKTWNLSSLWRLPLADGFVWLKAVPSFCAHEGALISALAPSGHVPRLLGWERGRCVMRDVPGEDLWEPTLDERIAMIDILVTMQRAWVGRVDELFAIGLHDWRADALRASIAATFERTKHELDAADAHTLERFVSGLERRLEAIAECRVPDSVVHGDYHPGNVRGRAGALTILDWGDAGVGNPLLDLPAFIERAPEAARPTLENHWHHAWSSACPGSDPDRAARLLAPIAAARRAATYLRFLDNIEPSEHAYHLGDPRDQLQEAARLFAAERE